MTLLKRATIKSYDAGSHRAAVGISGSLSVWLDSIAVSDGIAAASVVAGRECAVLFHGDDNPDDAVIVSVHGGGPPGGGGGTPTLYEDADQDTYGRAEQSADEDIPFSLIGWQGCRKIRKIQAVGDRIYRSVNLPCTAESSLHSLADTDSHSAMAQKRVTNV